MIKSIPILLFYLVIVLFSITTIVNAQDTNNKFDSFNQINWLEVDYNNKEVIQILIKELDDIESELIKYDEKIVILKRKITLLNIHNEDKEAIVNTNLDLALYYLYVQSQKLAAEFSLNALEIAKEINNTELIAKSNFKYGSILLFLTNQQKGIDFIIKAKTYYENESTEYSPILVEIYGIMANYYSNNNKKDSVQWCYDKGLALAIQNQDTNKITSQLILNTNFLLDDLPDSTNLINKKVKILKPLVELKGDYITTLMYKYLYIKKLIVINKKATIKDINNLQLEASKNDFFRHFIFELKFMFYESKQDYKNALINYKAFKKIVKENTESSYKASSIGLNKKLLTAENEITQIVEEKKQDKKYKKYKQIIIGLLAFLLLISLVLLYNLWKNKKQKELFFKEQIDSKNRKLVSDNLLIHEKQKIIESFKGLLTNHKSEIKDTELVGSLTRSINSHNNLEKDWSVFAKHFNEVHPNFYKNLNEQFSELTQNEIRLCTYIKINLSTKEIANLLNINPESVQKSRYRLRKKLSLSSEQNLDKFVQKI